VLLYAKNMWALMRITVGHRRMGGASYIILLYTLNVVVVFISPFDALLVVSPLLEKRQSRGLKVKFTHY
jgi:hypothetical protein